MKIKLSHEPSCTCAGCLALAWGRWLDQLGQRTSLGVWILFTTLTFRTQSFPWTRGFPNSGSGRPSSEFAHALFQLLVSHVESQTGRRIDYAVCDQFGAVNGRFHQHALLGGKGLESYPRKNIESWLNQRAGFARVLPFQRGAAYYVGRYLGNHVRDANWDVRVGEERMSHICKPEVWGNIVVASAEMPKSLFHQGLPGPSTQSLLVDSIPSRREAVSRVHSDYQGVKGSPHSSKEALGSSQRILHCAADSPNKSQ